MRVKLFIIIRFGFAMAIVSALICFGLSRNEKLNGAVAQGNIIQYQSLYDQKNQTPSGPGNKDMSNKSISEADLLRLLNEGKEKGYIRGELPKDPTELHALAQTIQRDLIFSPSEGFNPKTETGRQQLLLKRLPSGRWDDATDRRLPIFFEGPEWSALFRDALHVNEREPFLGKEGLDDWSLRQKVHFQESISEFPMLGRIWDSYVDINFEPDEISLLRAECLRVKARISEPVALEGLEKLIAACDEAYKLGLGLQMSSE